MIVVPITMAYGTGDLQSVILFFRVITADHLGGAQKYRIKPDEKNESEKVPH